MAATVGPPHLDYAREKVDGRVLSMLEECQWPSAVEPIQAFLRGNDVPTANEWYQAIQATGGELAIGWYQDSLERISLVTVWVPGDALYSATDGMVTRTGIPDLTENIEDNEKVVAVPLHIEQAHEHADLPNTIHGY